MNCFFVSFLLAVFSASTPAQVENIALHRCTTASSSYDHNLTAQLLTDGIVPDAGPAWLEVVTPDGSIDRVERENTLDADTHSRNKINGSGGWIEYRTHGYAIDADAAEVLFQEALEGGKGGPEHKVTVPVERREGALRVNLVFPHEGSWRVKEVSFRKEGEAVGGVLPSEHFVSAWMSAGCGDEWVLVDLGSVRRLDSVKLHWINAPAGFVCETSRDGMHWREASGGRCRFIRVSMSGGTADGNPYCLGEIEAIGPLRENVPQDGWCLRREGSQAWLPAIVPGTVLTSYIRAGAVPDPDFGDNWEQISDSYFNADFWYRKEFESEGTPDGKRSWLEFGGINWKAEVWLNGVQLGRIDGAFMRGHFDITGILQNGHNELLVKIIHNAHPGAVKEKTARWTGYNGGVLGADNPTFHASIGWDWMTTVRGRNIGIWDDVRIVQKGPAELSDPLVTSKISPDGLASITATVELGGEPVNAEVEGWIGDIRFSKRVEGCGSVVFGPEEFARLKDRHIELWWPNGYGEPALHDAGFVVKVNGAVSDSLHFKAGIREVRREERDGVLNLYVNNVRVDPMGGNWGFCQQNLDYSPEQYDIAVGLHRLENFNMIRNWVGQVPHEAFYDACDRHGIMVWQDFWLANPSDGPDPDDEGMFLANASDRVRRIRRHPSIVLYCGRNEGNPPESLDIPLRETVVAGLHPGIPYISDSADGPVSGHGPYRVLPARYYFSHQSGKLHSERGMPNVPVIESLRKMMPEEDLWPQGEMWGKHDYTADGAQKASTFNEMMLKAFGQCGSAEEFSALAQWVNYEGYRAIFESANSAGRKGLLLWMSHSCWPSMVWCTYDYYFQPTGAFFGCKKACEPVHIQYNPVSGMVEAVNILKGDSAGMTAAMKVYGYRGNLLCEKSSAIDIPGDTTVDCYEAVLPKGEPVYYLSLELCDSAKDVVSDNFYILGSKSGNLQALRELPPARLMKQLRRKDGNTVEVTLKNGSDTPALFMRLKLCDGMGNEELPVDYSDNYFSLMPGASKTVTISTRGGKARKLQVIQLSDVFCSTPGRP